MTQFSFFLLCQSRCFMRENFQYKYICMYTYSEATFLCVYARVE